MDILLSRFHSELPKFPMSLFDWNTVEIGFFITAGFSFVGIPLFLYVSGGKILVFYYVYIVDQFPDVRKGLNKFWIQKQVTNMKMWVLTVDDVIVGVTTLRPINVEKLDDVKPSKTDAMLTRLVINRTFRGKGLEKILIAHTINFAKEQGFKSVRLTVISVQTEAVVM